MKEKKEEVDLNRLERNRSLEKSEYKKQALHGTVNQLVKKTTFLYLISRFWQGSISRGFIFAILTVKYEEKALNFTIYAFSTSFKKESVNL